MVFTDFAEAKKLAEQTGQVVLGMCRKDEAPTYTLVGPDIDELAARNLAFEQLHGRPITSQEEILLSLVEARSA